MGLNVELLQGGPQRLQLLGAEFLATRLRGDVQA